MDYAGQTVDIIDGVTGEIQKAQIFVTVQGASNYSYADETMSQKVEDWIDSHIRAFSFFGGVPELVIPDNLQSGVSKTCRYEPDINPTYHYMVTINLYTGRPGSGLKQRSLTRHSWYKELILNRRTDLY